MKSTMIKLSMACLLFSVFVSAKSPVRYMSSMSLGVEYSCHWRGQDITEAEVPSHENIHQFALNYAPVEYIQFLIGLGMDRFEVDEYNQVSFEGDYGLSFSAGVYAYSPSFKVQDNDFLRIIGGLDFLYLNSEDDYDYRYSGPILDPFVGLLVYAGPVFNIEAGARWHFILGNMKNTETEESNNFSNSSTIRGYFALTLTAPAGAYASFNCDVSPETTRNWRDGPVEASIGFTVGFLLRTLRPVKKDKDKESEYFPNYDEMKKKQEDMLEEISE